MKSATATAEPMHGRTTRGLTRQQAKERTREALIEAALHVVARSGYDRASVDAIAAEAGYTKGAVYFHFRDKQQLFLEALTRMIERDRVEITAILTEFAGDARKLDEVLGDWIDKLRDRTTPLLMMELELEARRNPRVLPIFKEVIGQHYRNIGELIEIFFSITGRSSPFPSRELAMIITTSVEGFILARYTRDDPAITPAPVVKALLGMPI